MKALIKILIILLLTTPVLAQDDDVTQPKDPRVDMKIRAARVAYITEQLGLTPEEAEKFWPIYHEFSEKRVQLQKELRQAKKNPDPAKTPEQRSQELVDLSFKIKQQELDLEKDYSGRLLKVISAQKLRTLPDAEKQFRVMILEQIQRKQMQNERLRDRQQQRLQQRNN